MSGDKQYDATPHKLEEARKRGEGPKSQDIVAGAVLFTSALAAPLVLLDLTPMRTLAVWAITRIAQMSHGEPEHYPGEVLHAALPLITRFAIFMAAVVAVAVGSSLLQSGLRTSTEPLAPKLERLNPLNGLKRLFSQRGAVESLKTLLKAVFLVLVAYIFIRSEVDNLAGLARVELTSSWPHVVEACRRMGMRLAFLALAFGVIDVAWQSWQFKQQLKMTRQELLDEFKSQEGDPHIRARRRGLARALAKKAKLNSVQKARVVVTNPTHVAVALAYDDGEHEVPTLVVKGQGYRAQRIRELAQEYEVDVVREPPLARSIFSAVEEGDPIPPSLYLATAHVLLMVRRMEEARQAGASKGRSS